MAVVRVSTTNDFLMKTGFICFSCSNSHHQHIRQLHSMHYSGSGEIVTRSFAVGQVVVYTRTNVCRMAGGVVHRSRRARRGPWQCRSIRRLSIEDKSGLGEGRVRSEGGRNHRPRPNFCFFSAGLRIWNEHSRLSSTLIMAPALSNSPQ
jgi:hypothetical protein